MADYATKGLANGVGIPALVLGSLGFLGAANNENGGILGGVLGGNGTKQMAALMSENAMLKSENYSDKVSKEVYMQALTDNQTLETRIGNILTPVAQEVAANREKVTKLETEVKCMEEKALLREELLKSQLDKCCCEMTSKIDSVAQNATCGINQLAQAVAGLTGRVNAITKEVVPLTALCPEAMPRYNEWVAPTTTSSTTGA